MRRFDNVLFETTIDGFPMDAFRAAVDEGKGPEPEAEEAAVEEPVVESEPPAEAQETALDEAQKRDEKGRFASEDEPAPETDEIPAAYLTSVGLDLDTFSELDEKAQAAIRAGGRQYSELRRSADERSQELAEARRQREEQSDDDFADAEEPYVDHSAAQSQIKEFVQEGNFQDALILAYQAGGGRDSRLYEKTMDDWADEHPGRAARFDTRIALMEQEAALERKLAPAEKGRIQAAQTSAWAELERERPGLEDEISAAVQGGNMPRSLAAAIATEMNSGDAGRVKEALATLHEWAAGRSATSNASAAPAAKARQAEADAQLKNDAQVATAQHTKPPQPKVVLSEDEQRSAGMAEFMRLEGSRADIEAGLTRNG